MHISNANSYNMFLGIQFSIKIIGILLVYIRHLFNDYRGDNNKCKFSGLLSYTMYQLNVLIPISLYKILGMLHENVFSNDEFDEFWNMF